MSASENSVLAAAWATPHAKGLLALTAAVTAWGIGWPVNRAILYHLPPLSTVAVRSVIATAALFALTIWPPAGSSCQGSLSLGTYPIHSSLPDAPSRTRSPWS